MTESERVRAARDLHRFLTHESSGPGVADAALDQLRDVVRFDCATLFAWDAAAGRTTRAATRDFPGFVTRWGDSRYHHSPRFAALRNGLQLTRPQRSPGWQPGEESYEMVLRPCGFQDGFSISLRSDDRFVGTLATNMVAKDVVDELAIDLAELLTPGLAALLDPIPRLQPPTAALADGHAEAMVVTATGRARRLTAGADTDLARPTSPLWPMIEAVARGRRHTSSATLLVVDQVLDVSIHAARHDRHGALVVHRPVAAPFGLSVRELQVLAALGDGAVNAALAAGLGIARRTVATYVERLLAKTGCPNRTAAARLSARLNLVVWADPPAVAGRITSGMSRSARCRA